MNSDCRHAEPDSDVEVMCEKTSSDVKLRGRNGSHTPEIVDLTDEDEDSIDAPSASNQPPPQLTFIPPAAHDEDGEYFDAARDSEIVCDEIEPPNSPELPPSTSAWMPV